ncbi:MAG: hypothetical protein V3V28_08630 [Polaribacter sp.]|uniref:hypothetical protein n=1 Tax=Polaribacter sp. TaxID=1920175 RepID=UPI002F35F0E6
MKKLILIYILIFGSFIGCGLLTKTVKKERETNIIQKDSIVYNFIKKDSTIINTRTEITPASKTDLILRNVCDSLGNIKIAELQTQLGKTNIKIRTIDNTIYLEANTDSIIQVYKSKYEYKFKQDSIALNSSYKEKVKLKEVKVKTPKWAWLLLIGIALALFLKLRK